MACNDDDATIWLVRHGESTWNALGLVQGHADGPKLTKKGRQQSARIAESFRYSGVEVMYASDLERAQETATIIDKVLGIGVRTDRALRERSFGSHEGRPSHALDAAASGILADRVIDPAARPEGGESLDEVYRRARAFVERVREQHSGDIIVVTHGGTIRAMRAYGAGMAMNGMAWDPVPNGSVWDIRRPAPVQPAKC